MDGLFLSLRTVAAGISLACCLAMAGCTRPALNVRGDNFQDEFVRWGETNRAPEVGGGIYSPTTKGQQIEKNLGVR